MIPTARKPTSTMNNTNSHSNNSNSLTDGSLGSDDALGEVLQALRTAQQGTAFTQQELHSRLSTARAAITFLNSIPFLNAQYPYRHQIAIITELQNIAYHETDHGGVQDIAQWCLRAFLQLLSQGYDQSSEVLAGK